MKSFISIYTLNTIDNILCNYKKRVLRDFYDNFIDDKQKQKIDYYTFENQFLERKIDNPINKSKTIDNKKKQIENLINLINSHANSSSSTIMFWKYSIIR